MGFDSLPRSTFGVLAERVSGFMGLGVLNIASTYDDDGIVGDYIGILYG